jgi:hypothetical protein
MTPTGTPSNQRISGYIAISFRMTQPWMLYRHESFRLSTYTWRI